MLYVFHGTDTEKSLGKALSLVDSLRTKRPDASFVRVEADSWSASIIEEHVGGQGLFSNKYIVFLDRVTQNTEAKEALAGFMDVLKESTNIFIILEGKVLAELKKAFDKHAEKVVVSELPEVSKFGANKNEFNIFALADAIGNRDAMKSWTIYRQALEKGIEVESIIGTIFWQVKSMALARPSKSISETGLSPFVYSKAKKQADNYSVNELSSFMSDLISLYHDGHRGLVKTEVALESLLLKNKK